MTARMLVKGMALAVALSLAGCNAAGPGASSEPQTSAARSASMQAAGDEAHPQILAQYGGPYQNTAFTGYVEGLGRQLVAVSEQPDQKWTFTVLDSPVVNAFALPGGYVYITRGLAALANSEAELAGVIGHEIGHVTAGHSSLRQSRGQIASVGVLLGTVAAAAAGLDPSLVRAGAELGQVAAAGALANYSRGDEIDADFLGIRYIARAGYDPYAQADFLESMGASSALDARLAGQSHNPNRTDFFASHPASGPRTRQAIQSAEAAGQDIPLGADRHRDRFLAAVDGLTYGDSSAQGFVRGNRFVHPDLRFAFAAPEGFRIVNSTKAVVARGPGGAQFILDGARHDGTLTGYVRDVWAPGIARSVRTGQVQDLREVRINGLPAARAVLPMELEGRIFDGLLVIVNKDGALYRMTGLAPRDSGLLPAMETAAASFRRLSASEARRERPQRIDVVTVARGDTVASLAERMAFDVAREERFRVLNGLGPSETVKPGQKVKLVR